MLQQRGYYTIVLGDGNKIPLRFCTWTFVRFSEKNGKMPLSRLMELITTFGMTPAEMSSLILCAAEYVAIIEKKEFTYTEIDAYNWIDEMGGIFGSGISELIPLIALACTDSNSNGQEKKIPEKAKN